MTTPRLSELSVGDIVASRSYPLTRADLVRYAGASGDFNSIHWNEQQAAAVGLPGVIAHGMLTMATAVRIVVDWVGDPGAVLDYGVRFTKPVVVPNEATGAEPAQVNVEAKVAVIDLDAGTARIDLKASFEGAGVLNRARVLVRLPQ